MRYLGKEVGSEQPRDLAETLKKLSEIGSNRDRRACNRLSRDLGWYGWANSLPDDDVQVRLATTREG